MPARATGAVVTYSQVGSRGLPCTSRKSSRSRRSGRASSHSRVSAAIVACVHSIAWRASTLNALDVEPADGRRVVVAPDAARADLAQPGHHRVGLGPVAHDVAQLPDLVHRGDHRQHRVEGRDVGMDVREDGDAHRGSVAQGCRPGRSGARLTTGADGARRDPADSGIDRPARSTTIEPVGLQARHAGVARPPACRPAGPRAPVPPPRAPRPAAGASRRRGCRPARRAAARPRPARPARQPPARSPPATPRGRASSWASASARTRLRGDRAPEPGGLDHGREEADLLGDRVDEQRPGRRAARRRS